MLNYEIVNTSMLETNTYIVYGENKEAMVIDIGSNAKKIFDIITEKGYTLKYILVTHMHFDHSNGVKELKDLSGAKVYIPKDELEFMHSPANLAAAVGIEYNVFEPDELLLGGETLHLLGYDIEVVSTPGHTKAGLTYIIDSENVMFCGDTLFKGSYGRVDLPTGNFTKILESIEKLCGYKKNYLVLCGHGPSTTLDDERVNNGYSKDNN